MVRTGIQSNGDGVTRREQPVMQQSASSSMDFPRGGGTTLSPFEHRQALREVSAESRARKRGSNGQSSSHAEELFSENGKRQRGSNSLAATTSHESVREGKDKKVKRDHVNLSKKRRGVKTARDAPVATTHPVLQRENITIGTRLLCTVTAVQAVSLVVALPDHLTGHVPITNISESLTGLLEQTDATTSSTATKVPQLKDIFSVGQCLVASVVAVHTINGRRQKRGKDWQRIELTVDPKIVNEGVGAQDMCHNYILPLVVRSAEDNGYLVSMGSDTITGFIPYAEAPDLVPGQVVRASITSVSESKRSFTASLRASRLLGKPVAEAPSSTALLPGNSINALIMDVSDQGLQVKLFGLFDGTASSGNIPKDRIFKVGQRAKANVLWEESQAFEPAGNRIALSFVDLASESTGSKASISNTAIKRNELVGESSMEDNSAVTPEIRKKAIVLDTAERDHEEERDVASGPLLDLGGALSWNAASSTSSAPGAAALASGTEAKASGARKVQKSQQEDLTSGLSEKAPVSATDYERLLLSSPNSSFLWIQFISFYVQLGDSEKARQTARRALQTIGFREEEERLNVWTALLNLENTFGEEATLESTFKEACAYNDPLEMSFRMTQIFEDAEKFSEADELWRKTAKKFGHSVDVWTGYHRFVIRSRNRQSVSETSQAVVSRSMQSLDKSKHVTAISAFAINEFKLGDTESGRTIFEGLVDAYPKRLDIWLQYVDQEVRSKNASQARTLFERMFAVKQSSKKARSILRKWLEFEKDQGSSGKQQQVLALAREYVSSNANTSNEEMQED